MKLSSVAIFAYARKEHLEKTVNALKENYFASDTNVYFFFFFFFPMVIKKKQKKK